jgi:hypothetical protein
MISHGSTCTQSCNAGYQATAQGVCADGQYTPIQCIANPPPPPVWVPPPPVWEPPVWAPPPPAWAPFDFQCYKDNYDTFVHPQGGNFYMQPYYCKNKHTLEIVDNSYCSGTDNGCEITHGCVLGTNQMTVWKTGPNKSLQVSSRYDAGCEGLISQAAQIQQDLNELTRQQDHAIASGTYQYIPPPPAVTEWYGNIWQHAWQ